MAERPHSLRQFLSDAAVYGLGQLAVRLTSLVLVPLYAHALAPEQFGLLALLEAYRAGFVLFAGLGLSEAVGYAIARQNRDFREVLGTALGVVAGGCVVLSAVLWSFRRPLAAVLLGGEENTFAVDFLAICGPLEALHLLCLSSLRYADRARLFALLAWIETVLRLTLNIVLVAVLRQGIDGILLAYLAAFGLVVACDLALFAGDALRRVRRELVRPLLDYGLASWPFQAASVAGLNADRVILEHYVGLALLAPYSLATKAAGLVAVAMQPLQSALRPHLYRAPEGDWRAVRRVGGLTLGFLCAAMLTVLLAAPELVHWLGAGKYDDALPLLPLVLAALAGRLAFSVLGFGPLYAGRPQIQSLVVVLAFVTNLALNLLLVPRLGVLGACWAGAGGSLVMAICGALATRRVLRLSQPQTELLAAGLLALLLAAYYLSPALLPLPARMALLALAAATALWLAARAGWLQRGAAAAAEWWRRRAEGAGRTR